MYLYDYFGKKLINKYNILLFANYMYLVVLYISHAMELACMKSPD